MPRVDITQQLYDYLNHNLVDGSIDATIRTLISQDDFSRDRLGIDVSSGNQSGSSIVPQDDKAVGGKGDSTNSGYIR